MRSWSALALCMLHLTVAGGVSAASAEGHGAATVQRPQSVAKLHLPATFRGVLPCADCEGLRYHLDLWPDQVFHLRREWSGTAVVRDDIGRWSVEPKSHKLILQGGAEMPRQFEILDAQRLRVLDRSGKRIDSHSPYELKSDGTLAPTEVSLVLGGEMRYMADAATFLECLTRRRYPIALEAQFPDLQEGYRQKVSGPGAPLYVTFEGSIVERPRMEGEGTEPTVVVTRYINAWPDKTCERARPEESSKRAK